MDKYIINNNLPELPANADNLATVSILKDRFIVFKKNYEGMLYFCGRILNKPKEKIIMRDLEDFELQRFRKIERERENFSWPIHEYLDKIKEQEKEIAELEKKVEQLNLLGCN